MIQAQLEDGRILEFPDGTDPSVIQSTVRKTLGIQEPPKRLEGAETLSPEAQKLPLEQQQILLDAKRRQLEASGVIAPTDDLMQSGASRRAQAMEALRAEDPNLASIIEEMGGLERTAVGFQQGLRTAGRGTGKLFGQDFFPEVNEPAQKKLGDVSLGASAGKIAGEVAPFLAAAPLTGTLGTGFQITKGGTKIVPQLTSTAARAASSGGLGAFEGGAIAAGKDKSGGEVLFSTLLGGAFGSGVEIAIPLISRASSRVLRRLGSKSDEALDAAGNLTPDAKKILNENNVEVDQFLREVIEEADIGDKARKEAFEKLGTTPTQAQVTRDKDLFQEQIESFTKQGKVTEAIERQDRILQEGAKKELGSIGGVSERANQSVSSSITDKAVQLDSEISKLYQAAREAAPGAKNVRFNKASATLRESAPSDDLAGGVVKALKGKMEQMGVLDGFKPSGRVSIESAEELRKFANSLFQSTNDIGRQTIRKFKDSLDDDALSASGEEFFKQARAAKSSFEQGLSTTGKSKFSKRKKSLVRDILEEKIPEDKIAERVINRGSTYDSKSLSELKSYLTSGTDKQIAQGVQAWNDIRSKAMSNIIDNAFKGPINREGIQSLSRAGLERGIKSIGPEKYAVLFTPAERTFLNDLVVVSALREAPPGVRPSPSGPAIRKLQSALSKIPFLGGEIANDVIDNVSAKASEKKVLKLISEAEKIAKQNTKVFERRLKQSALPAAPAVAIPAITNEEEQ